MNDIIIPVKNGDDNEELRYCLRSISENLPHRNIIIAGYLPKWVTGVIHVSVDLVAEPNKYRRVARNIIAGARCHEASEWFMLFNDDMFVMEKMESLPIIHRGLLANFIDQTDFTHAPQQRESLVVTHTALELAGIKVPINYDFHAPMMMNKHALIDLLTIIETMGLKDSPIQLRSFYGNMHHIGGELHEDVKLANPHIFKYWHDFPIVSTTDESFAHGRAGEEIRAAFPNKCKYEL